MNVDKGIEVGSTEEKDSFSKGLESVTDCLSDKEDDEGIDLNDISGFRESLEKSIKKEEAAEKLEEELQMSIDSESIELVNLLSLKTQKRQLKELSERVDKIEKFAFHFSQMIRSVIEMADYTGEFEKLPDRALEAEQSIEEISQRMKRLVGEPRKF